MHVLQRWLSDRGPAPVITCYLEQGRIELSGATAGNAVAKAVNLLRDELLLEPGDVVWLDLPCHWQAPVLALAAWAAGLTVAVGAAPDEAAATIGTGAGAAVGVPLAVSLHPLGLPLLERTPSGWEDFAALARVQADRADWSPAPETATWLVDGGRRIDGRDLAGLGPRLAPGQRILTAHAPDSAEHLHAMTWAPALARGAVILDTIGDFEGIQRQEGNLVLAEDV